MGTAMFNIFEFVKFMILFILDVLGHRYEDRKTIEEVCLFLHLVLLKKGFYTDTDKVDQC